MTLDFIKYQSVNSMLNLLVADGYIVLNIISCLYAGDCMERYGVAINRYLSQMEAHDRGLIYQSLLRIYFTIGRYGKIQFSNFYDVMPSARCRHLFQIFANMNPGYRITRRGITEASYSMRSRSLMFMDRAVVLLM
jgi:hypothetical protein